MRKSCSMAKNYKWNKCKIDIVSGIVTRGNNPASYFWALFQEHEVLNKMFITSFISERKASNRK